ncbi:DUF1177 domain-containing protein [Pseudalkalibacillus sp. A8]|uniref:DUF1177 domain-containing protein n=1 Tax=Pseudalkalibacillus sp. A8 TaxID=3382641 RepID=UPI0038B5B4A5
MTLKQTITISDLLDCTQITGNEVVTLFKDFALVKASYSTVKGAEGSIDFVRISIKGTNGKLVNGDAPTFGIIGRLGGIGARPKRIGIVSDADGAVAALSAALKLAEMSERSDRLEGDVIITTQICPFAPTIPHEPVEFMGSPVDMSTLNEYEVLPEMDAILSIDTTKGNRIINHKGIAISPTIKEGYILRVSEDLLRLMEMTTGRLPVTYPITMQDITPYGNGLYHINSILQPVAATSAPVVGLAITAESIVPGCGTGASHETDIAMASRYSIEVAKEFTNGVTSFYDEDEFETLTSLYGSMMKFQTLGSKVSQ